jgi:hypothetical protein
MSKSCSATRCGAGVRVESRRTSSTSAGRGRYVFDALTDGVVRPESIVLRDYAHATYATARR